MNAATATREAAGAMRARVMRRRDERDIDAHEGCASRDVLRTGRRIVLLAAVVLAIFAAGVVEMVVNGRA